MGRYYEHDDELRVGSYPKIHDKLKAVINIEKDIKGKTVLDLGGCSGAFGLWALAHGAKRVIVNDMRKDYLDLAKEYDKIHRSIYNYTGELILDNQKISKTSDFKQYGNIDTIIGRRIFYELRDDEVYQRCISQAIESHCERVYAQGLVRVPNHKEKLWNVALEAQRWIDNGYTYEEYNGNDIIVLNKA